MKKLNQDELEQQIIKPFERIAALYNVLEQTTDNYGTDTPLYPPEIHTITMIGNYPQISLTELAIQMGVTKGTTTKTVQRLVKKGMVVKKFAPHSENQIALTLTAEGEIARQHHEAYDHDIDRQLIKIYQQVPTEFLPYLAMISTQTEAFFQKMIAKRQK